MILSSISKTTKATIRGGLLAISLIEVLSRFAILRMKLGTAVTLRDRAEWLHRACAIIVRRLSMDVSASGRLPQDGLLVSNHLSHLDILLYAAVMPCVFVSKSDVLQWPMFGILARCGGTIFVERSRVHAVHDPASEIADALRSGIRVMLFPEGTSTDGSAVLPFRSAFFEPSVATGAVICPAAIAYTVSDGVEADLCYYGDITFFPHLLTVLARRRVRGTIVFGNEIRVNNRKSAARAAWKEVVAIRERMAGAPIAESEFA
jgi:lyso-ornithine lipid O-acyltransferase